MFQTCPNHLLYPVIFGILVVQRSSSFSTKIRTIPGDPNRSPKIVVHITWHGSTKTFLQLKCLPTQMGRGCFSSLGKGGDFGLFELIIFIFSTFLFFFWGWAVWPLISVFLSGWGVWPLISGGTGSEFAKPVSSSNPRGCKHFWDHT